MTNWLAVKDGQPVRPSGTLSAEVAAALLGTKPNALRLWEERFGYPVPTQDADRGVRYSYSDVVALREALNRHVSVASAVAVAMREPPA